MNYQYRSQFKTIKVFPSDSSLGILPKQGDLFECIVRKQTNARTEGGLPIYVNIGSKVLYMSAHIIAHIDETNGNQPEVIYCVDVFNLSTIGHASLEVGRLYGKSIDLKKLYEDNDEYFVALMRNYKMFFKKE